MCYHAENRMSGANKSRLLGIMIRHCHVGMYELERSAFCFLLTKDQVAHGRARTIGADNYCSRDLFAVFKCGRNTDTVWSIRYIDKFFAILP